MLDSLTFLRIIKTGFVNFWRNFWMSAAATMVMVITLVILSVLLLLSAITSYTISSIKDRVDISVYMNTGIAEAKVLEIKKELESDPIVKEVSYVAPEEALRSFREKHAGDDSIIDALGELNENPLSATLQIKASELENYETIAKNLEAEKYQTYIKKINFTDNKALIDKLNKILRFIITLGVSLVAVFSVIAVLVIFNTITLTIYNRREEVEIMRLVGATNAYIRGPFIVEALLYSCFATLITAGLLVPFYLKLLPEVARYLGNTGGGVFDEKYMSIWAIVGMQFGVAFILSFISSLLAIRRYLKV